MVALLIFTGRRDIMGPFVNGRLTNAAAIIGTATVLFLNVILVVQTLRLSIPGLPASD
jgi:manganese transport protein